MIILQEPTIQQLLLSQTYLLNHSLGISFQGTLKLGSHLIMHRQYISGNSAGVKVLI